MPILPLAVLPLMVVLLGATNALAQVAETQVQQKETPQTASVTAKEPGDSNRLVHAAAAWLAQQSSIRAGMRQQVEIYNQRLLAAGTYLQGSIDSRPLRIELRFRLDHQEGSLQQVYDGHSLWTFRQLGDETELQSIDFHRVRASAASQTATGPPLETLAVGGLPALLETIAQQFDFGEARATSTAGHATLTLTGEWKPERLATLLHPSGADLAVTGETTDSQDLPAHMPDHVVLTLDQRKLYPHRIDFRRRRQARWFETILGAPPRVETLATIELFDVQFNKVIDPRSFRFDPGDRKVADATNEYINKHR